MTGRFALVAQTVGRRSGLAGLVVALGGGAAVATAGRAWWEARAELQLLGAAQDRVVSTIAGWQHLPGWVAVLAGAIAATLGVLLAADRHPGWTRPVTVIAGGVLLAGAAFGALYTPDLGRFPDRGGALADLRSVRDTLPVDVELTLQPARGDAPTVLALAGLAILAGVLTARELDRS